MTETSKLAKTLLDVVNEESNDYDAIDSMIKILDDYRIQSKVVLNEEMKIDSCAWKLRWDYTGLERHRKNDITVFQKDWNQTIITQMNQISTQINMSTGSLGQGLSAGNGMALGGRIDRKNFRVFVMLGDGECQSGQIWEAAMSAAHFRLASLVAIVDRNGLCIDGHTEEVMGIEPLEDRFAGFGWQVSRIDGHDVGQVLSTLDSLSPPGKGKPQVIIADTVKGRGVAMMEGALNWHVGNLESADYDAVMAELDAGLKPAVWEHPK